MIGGGHLIYPLSPLDHLMPRHHVPKLLYFASTSEPATITSVLRNALAKTIAAMPFISGLVVPTKYDCQKGSLSVQGPYHTANDILCMKDLRNDYEFEELRSKNFPTDAIPADIIAPKQSSGPPQVMVAQANFLKGGLLLYFAVHHCVVDEVGILNIIKVWSTYCRGEDGSLMVKPDWFDRAPLVQCAGPGNIQEHSEYTLFPPEGIESPEKNKPSNYFPTSSCVTSSIFFFSDSSLARLKQAAASNPTVKQNDPPFISTNDALCALLWTSITRARLPSTSSAAATTTLRFSMTINGRPRLSPPLSPDYTGNVVLITKASSHLPALLSQPLAATASCIRRSIAAVDDAYIRSVIRMVQSVDDVGRLAPRAQPPREKQEQVVGCSSWARMPWYEGSWGRELGRCERVRWRVLRTDGVAVVFPRIPGGHGGEGEEGGLEVVAGLTGEVMERLKVDEVFMGFAEWRCS